MGTLDIQLNDGVDGTVIRAGSPSLELSAPTPFERPPVFAYKRERTYDGSHYQSFQYRRMKGDVSYTVDLQFRTTNTDAENHLFEMGGGGLPEGESRNRFVNIYITDGTTLHHDWYKNDLNYTVPGADGASASALLPSPASLETGPTCYRQHEIELLSEHLLPETPMGQHVCNCGSGSLARGRGVPS